jgi:multiple sugar transport system permease protein
MFRGTWGILRWNDMMAATLVFMLPPLVLFFLFQRLFIQGIVLTGLKG